MKSKSERAKFLFEKSASSEKTITIAADAAAVVVAIFFLYT